MTSVISKNGRRRKESFGGLFFLMRKMMVHKLILFSLVVLYCVFVFRYTSQDTSTSHQIIIPRQELSTTWPFRKDASSWCYHNDNNNNGAKSPGLVYVKVAKTASSTLAGINMRIARKVGARVLNKRKGFLDHFWNNRNDQICSHSFLHGRDLLLLESNRNNKATDQKRLMNSQLLQERLLWSFVREPAARGISAFYHFQVSRKKQWPTMGHLINYLTEESTNFQFLYLATNPNPKQLLLSTEKEEEAQNYPVIKSHIQNYILQEYDFLGVVERMSESLAVMVLLWDLNIEDIIVLSAKLSGQYDDGRYKNGCVKIQQRHPGVASDEAYLEQYLNVTFRQSNRYDYMLYQLTNERLSATIQALGVERVHGVQMKIEMLKKRVQDECLHLAVFPCSANGTWQYKDSIKDCYWSDSGCGHSCVDRIVYNNDNAYYY